MVAAERLAAPSPRVLFPSGICPFGVLVCLDTASPVDNPAGRDNATLTEMACTQKTSGKRGDWAKEHSNATVAHPSVLALGIPPSWPGVLGPGIG